MALASLELALKHARSAQSVWSERTPRQRFSAIGRIANLIAVHQRELLDLSPRANASPLEVLTSELFPLADACRFTAKVGARALAPTSLSFRYAAWWMGRIGVRTTREPWGIVLVLAPSNYPLFLPGVQIIQALAAGNAVVVKPAPGCEQILARFQQCLIEAGIPQELHPIIDSSVESGQHAITQGVDKVLLTGSASTGRAVLAKLQSSLTPSTMELSGCDAVFLSDKADLTRASRCLAYGLRLNGGATCIAPRRVFVTHAQLATFRELLVAELERKADVSYRVPVQVCGAIRAATQQATSSGAEIVYGDLPLENSSQMQPIVLSGATPQMRVAREDLFGPVVSIMPVNSMAEALELDRLCPYSLAASIFGPVGYAEHWASQINAGCIVINDIIVPTADPRVAFGGRQQSGWGVTRGWEGLLEMTRPKTICTRYGNWLPHLDRRYSRSDELLGELLKLFHARSLSAKFGALRAIINSRPHKES